MTRFSARAVLRCLTLATALQLAVAQQDEASEPRWGHSSHGAAYDEGPRQRPWKMEGIGATSISITTSVPEVQAWFDQGLTLLHGFWYYEAERSFRWCLKLDPECAMAYWGMALATRSGGGPPGAGPNRPEEFLAVAVARKDAVTPRERAFIEVSEAFQKVKKRDAPPGFGPPAGTEEDPALEQALVALDRLLMDYPDEVEAKALYWLQLGLSLRENAEQVRYGLEAVLDDILEVEPEHVGALHYRIHNWDGKEGHYVVDSCMLLSEVAPNCGHLQHMPGHVLSGIGLWHEAAIAMDSATRVEKAYMHERVIVPEDNWDYIHNLDYLCYIQEQLGMVDQALLGARQIQLGPAFADGAFFQALGKVPTMRALVKFERWAEILEPGRIGWDRTSEVERLFATYSDLRANIGLGHVEEAQELLDELGGMVAEGPPPGAGGPEGGKGPGAGPPAGGAGAPGGAPPDPSAMMAMFAKKQFRERLPELEALLMLARGEALEGLSLLHEAAELQVEEWQNDPPMEPTFLFNRLGDEYLALGAPTLAIDCYERTLETVVHDGFALAGLVVAHASLGDEEAARAAMAKLRVVWSDADPNRWLEAAEATGIEAEPFLDTPVAERNYKRDVLDVHGPSLWTRPLAPRLTAKDAAGEDVALVDYEGKNVVAIFYLGDECLHCMEQIAVAEERLDALNELETVVLAISKDPVEEIAEQAEGFGVTLLSDPSFESARRFRSYDDFEDIELHSTFIIDRDGRVHWSRIGGEPFTDFDYIEAELERLNREDDADVASQGRAHDDTSG